jgi:DNA polymerase sigma
MLLSTIFSPAFSFIFYFGTSETKFHVKPLPHARIPIVKLSLDPSTALPLGIACDIGFENRLALENTRLLYCYAVIDPTRVRTLVLFRESRTCLLLLMLFIMLQPSQGVV